MRYLRVPHAPLAEILIGALLLATVLLLAVVLRTPRVTAYRAAAPRRPRGRTWPTVIGLALVVPLLWSLLTWPILQPSRHSLRNWRAAVPVWLVNAFISVGFAQAPLAPMKPDINSDGVVDIQDLARTSGCFMHPLTDPGCAVTDVNHDNQNSVLDIVRVAVRWYQPFTRIADSSPTNGEDDVSITRETVIRFSAPIDAAAVLPSNFYATFAGQTLSARLYLSSDMKTVTLFYDDDLPASARVRVTINGDAVADANGYAMDVRGNGLAGGSGTIDFDTLSLSTVPGTQVCGTVFASELGLTPNGETTDVPLAGVRITVDGAEATMRADGANDGAFCLNPAPAGSFFVHIDGRTATATVPPGAYYPFVGKQWASAPGQSTNIGNIYLPLIAPDTLQAVSVSNPTAITFPAAVIQAHPELSGTQITVPADSLFANNGTRGGSVGIAPVPPDRLPSPLPPELDFPIVITVQTNGPENFDAPAPICMPNLPQPSTGFAPFPGTKMALYSFNHDTGRFEAVAPMTVSADGARVCTDPGYGIVAPGWHGTQPGARGKGGPIKTLPPNNCPGINPLTQCCTSAGPVPRTAVSNLADCPNRIPKPTYVPQPNGCGPEGYGYAIPDCAPVLTALGTVSYICFTEACNAHDVCYGSCNAGAGHKNTCDGNFQDDMRFKCDSSFPIDPIARQNCYAAASVYFNAVNKTSIGNDAYNAGQQEACDCCASGSQAAAAAQTERVFVANPTAALLNQIAPPTDAGQETGAGAGQEAGAISAAQPQSAAAKILLRVTSPDAPAVVDSSLGDLSTGVHYFAIRNWFTDVVVQRGRTGANGIAHENLNLQARTLYRQYILQPSTLLVGFADFTTPLDGLTIDIPPTYLGNSTAADSDGDGLNDDGELVMGTQVNNPDSDGDGVNDGAEVQQGTDPLGGLIAQTGIIATTQTPGPAVDICAVNDLVAVAEMETGVSIFNVFNSINPTIMAQVNTPGQAQSVACGDNNLLAVADGSGGLAVIDFSDPPAAFISHQVNLGGSVHAVASAGSLAYAGLTNGNVVVVDMQSGTVLQTISAGAAAIEDLSTEKENLFVLLDSQLRAYSVAQGILTFQGQTATTGYVAEGITGRKRLFVGGGFAYATSYPGYDVFDVQNLAFPVRVGNASTPGPNSFKQIVANGSGLGVATVGVNPRNDGTHDLWLYDVSDPTRTGDLLTTFSTPDVARAVAIYNGLAYVADSAGGMHVMSYLAYDTQGIPPTIALSTNFVSGQAEEGKVMRVTAAVADDSQVRSVQFYINDVQTQTDGNFPFEVRFITPRINPPPAPGRPGQPQDAIFTLRARAIDTGGNATWSDTMTVTLTADATAPQVTLVAPASNSVNIQG
ncbi:MAG: Ig-like domain-containing protein, partial [Anaerolineae bacterium]